MVKSTGKAWKEWSRGLKLSTTLFSSYKTLIFDVVVGNWFLSLSNVGKLNKLDFNWIFTDILSRKPWLNVVASFFSYFYKFFKILLSKENYFLRWKGKVISYRVYRNSISDCFEKIFDGHVTPATKWFIRPGPRF